MSGAVERRLLAEHKTLTAERAEIERAIKEGWATLDAYAMRRKSDRLAAIDARLEAIRATEMFKGHRPKGSDLMLHVCNAWCFDGVHAHLFDSEISERPALAQVAPRLVANLRTQQGQGLTYLGYSEVSAQGAPAPGTVTRGGVARGRFVIWCR